MAIRSSASLGLALSRRRFLEAGAAVGAALLIGFELGDGRRVLAATTDGPFAPNAFVRIAPDGTVTIIAKHVELGQGSYTGLATILAEELDADWSQVTVESAPADVALYKNLLVGAQLTGGSSAMANSWDQLRNAGGVARAMLVSAASAEWGVPASGITVERGVVQHAASGRRATFGVLAAKAATMPVPASVTLKEPKDWKLVGQQHLPRLDSKAKTDGSAQFTLDVYLPEMLTALIARPPRFGATVRSFDASAALQVNGVTDVVEVPAGIAVLGRGFWAARKGRAALKIAWDESAAEMRSSEALFTAYTELARQPGTRARRDGDPDAAIAGAATVVEAVYEFPYLAHAPMEPLDCVVRLGADACEVWAGSQAQTIDQETVATVVGLPKEKVQIHTLLAGGSFGRRATPNGDVAGEAASIAKAIGGRQPVKLVWTREDDIRGGRYRPLYVHRIRAGIDASGRIVGWEHRIVGQSIFKGSALESRVKDGIDPTSVEGATTLPYDVGSIGVDLHTTDVGVPVLWWRSVGSTHTAYSTETFIDELAHAAGRDPVEFRRAMLAKAPRHLAALDLATQKAGWGTALPTGRARGFAIHESFKTVVAQVAEVSLGADGRPKVERVVCAVDCGIAINPDVVRAQMEGSIGFGFGAALHSEITLVDGRVQQSNFNDYRPLRIEEMPAVEVYIVPSASPPTGVGEPGVPPIAPAVANAMFQLTGRRARRLPFARRTV
ncbi:MAG TPA: xanthine dehydrogenase family protein molybdopterin-binding subunit [Candidatus Binatia bacterium]|jgi:isoquinoline 1-oxidoreductase beta subunit|nr:xanthine dehydrogenase family protein molybdopterin-binding subunit [Candidatus Binatia bacterium]